MPMTGQPDPNEGNGMAGFDLALRLVVSVLGLGGLGLAVDLWLGWAPWLTLVGVFGGFGAWLVAVARRG